MTLSVEKNITWKKGKGEAMSSNDIKPVGKNIMRGIGTEKFGIGKKIIMLKK